MFVTSATRRSFLGIMALGLSGPVAAAAGPWKMRLVQGPLVGNRLQAGLLVELAEGWKTYWRVPGEGGIAPQIEIAGASVAGSSFGCPLPRRLTSADGETIGYTDQVLFPISITVREPSNPEPITITALLGVCQEVCIPARFEAKLEWPAANPPKEDIDLLRNWAARVPQPDGMGLLSNPRLAIENGQNTLLVDLARPVDDLFVEGPEQLYFRAPHFEGPRAAMIVDGLQSASELKGQQLRITITAGKAGTEQTLTLP